MVGEIARMMKSRIRRQQTNRRSALCGEDPIMHTFLIINKHSS